MKVTINMRDINIRKFGKKAMCIALSGFMAVGLFGCGKGKTEDVPQLLEPISSNEAYHPVVYGDIGEMVIKSASVVPTDYCYFYDSSVTLSKIYVNVGDDVTSDTLLAEAQVESSEDDDVESSLAVQKYTHEINEKIFAQNQAELDWKIKACEEVGDTEGASEYKLEKAINVENNRYENVLYQYQINNKSSEEDSEESSEEDGKLKSTIAGKVTYTKSAKSGDSISGGENVVVVSDYNSPYIEITGETYKKNGYSMYNNMYTVINGQRYEIEPYSYTNQEIATAQSMSSLPYMRFKLKDVKNPEKILSVGSVISLYFSTSDAKNVLVIGNDSLYEENGETFVYVKTEDSDKERRNVTVGVSDSNYTEVVSGLSEGEEVYYASDAMTPGNYTEYTVALNSYSDNGTSKTFSMEDLNSVSYTAPCDGRFKEIDVAKDQEVKKGDILYIIDSGGGSAATMEVDNQIQDENSSYSDSLSDYNSQIADFEQQIKNYKDGKVATSSDAENILYMAEQLTCQKNVVVYNKDLLTYVHNAKIASLNASKQKVSTNNDGSGNITVYAEQDGTVLSVDATADVAVTEGQNVVTIGSGESKIMALTLSDAKLCLGQTVSVVNTNDSSKKFVGTCVGTSGDSGKAYITTDDDGTIHVTKSSNDGDLVYYIYVEGEAFYSKPKAYQVSYPKVSYENVVMIPTNMVYHESSKTSSSEYDYVWLVKDGELMKQYVTLGDSSKSQTIILTGLSEGDVIAKETAATSTNSGSSSKKDSSDDSSDSESDNSSNDESDDSDDSYSDEDI
jgi:multidrug efflux pump subunit AcrA (membrane-fusion protein)